MKKEVKDAIDLVAQTIYDKKGSNIIGLDVSDFSSLTDGVVIAEGTIERHVVAIAKSVIDALKEKGMRPFHVEGLQTGDWVLIDYLDFMIHIFKPVMRETYQLEQLWSSGKLIDLKIDTSTLLHSSSRYYSEEMECAENP